MKLNAVNLGRCPAPARLGLFALLLLLIWAPLAIPIYWLVSDRNIVSIVTMALLYGEFILLAQIWGRYVYRTPNLLRSFGLQGNRQNGLDFLRGLSLGLSSLLVFFSLQGCLGWLSWQLIDDSLPQIILEGLVMAVLICLAEELLFRGWLLNELERDYAPKVALWGDSLIFAGVHFLKPIAEMYRMRFAFLALLLLGMALVWAKRSTRSYQHAPQGQLGLSIGLHTGLVWGYYIINVGQLIHYTKQVPEWVTGIDRNPLAGVLGVAFMGAIAGLMRQLALGRDRTHS